jgi:hypothetical protein
MDKRAQIMEQINQNYGQDKVKRSSFGVKYKGNIERLGRPNVSGDEKGEIK